MLKIQHKNFVRKQGPFLAQIQNVFYCVSLLGILTTLICVTYIFVFL